MGMKEYITRENYLVREIMNPQIVTLTEEKLAIQRNRTRKRRSSAKRKTLLQKENLHPIREGVKTRKKENGGGEIGPP